METRIEMLDRLRLEGREKDATCYRNQVREQLRAAGKARKEAREASWDALRAAFPPAPPVVQADDSVAPALDNDEVTPDEDWVIERFSPLRTLSKWQAKHGVVLTDEALRELLTRILGFHVAWAWMNGAKGCYPPSADSYTCDNLGYVASIIDRTFGLIAEVMTVEELAKFHSPEQAETTGIVTDQNLSETIDKPLTTEETPPPRETDQGIGEAE